MISLYDFVVAAGGTGSGAAVGMSDGFGWFSGVIGAAVHTKRAHQVSVHGSDLALQGSNNFCWDNPCLFCHVWDGRGGEVGSSLLTP